MLGCCVWCVRSSGLVLDSLNAVVVNSVVHSSGIRRLCFILLVIMGCV